MSFGIRQTASNFQLVGSPPNLNLNPKGSITTFFPAATLAGSLLIFCYAAYSTGSQDVTITDGVNPYNYGAVVNDSLTISPSSSQPVPTPQLGFSMGAMAWAGKSNPIGLPLSPPAGITLTNNGTVPLLNVCTLIFEVTGVPALANPSDALPVGNFGDTASASPGQLGVLTQTGSPPVPVLIPLPSGDLVFVFTAATCTGIGLSSGFSLAGQANPFDNLQVQGQFLTSSSGFLTPSIPLSGTIFGDWVCLAASFF